MRDMDGDMEEEGELVALPPTPEVDEEVGVEREEREGSSGEPDGLFVAVGGATLPLTPEVDEEEGIKGESVAPAEALPAPAPFVGVGREEAVGPPNSPPPPNTCVGETVPVGAPGVGVVSI